MINQRGVDFQCTIGCTLLLFAGCSIGSAGNGGTGGTQGGQGGSGTGGSSVSSSGKGGSSGTLSSSSNGGQGGGSSASGGQGGKATGGGTTDTGTGGQGGKTSTGDQTGGTISSGQTGGTITGATGGGGGTGTGGTTGTATGGKSGGSGGQAGKTGSGGQGGATGVDGGLVSGCVGGKEWPTANPAAAGPFEVAADKGVGPLAGYTPDPIYGDQQQRFNVYRPKNLATSGYCHPILIWANGHTDNPEPNPPLCVVDQSANKWCGQYLPLMNQLASHGFVVVASLSTTTSKGDPLPTIAGLDWIIQQSEDSTSPYYHRLDITNIGQLGHSEGAMSTCMVASEPRYKALAAICGTRTLTGVHTPFLFYCGGKDTTVDCSGVHDVFATVTDQPAFFIDELASDHGWWVYQGASGVSLSMAAAWFRVHLMNDTANRKYFYGSGCTFCKDSRVKAEQNSLMAN